MTHTRDVWRRLNTDVVAISLLAGVAIAIRLPAIHQPLDRDMAAYAAIGRRLSSDSLPYRDLFDHKQPLIYAVFWLLHLVGDSTVVVRLGASAVAAAIAALMYWLFVPAMGRARAGAASAAAVVVGASRVVEGTDINTEHVFAVFVVVAVGLPFRFAPGHHRWVAAAVGVASALALLGKAIAIFAFPAIVLSLVLSAPDRGAAARSLVRAVAAGAAPILIVVGIYARAGAVDDLVYANWTYNNLYAAGQTPSLQGFFDVADARQPILLLALGAVVAAAIFFATTRRLDRLVLTLATWTIGMWVAAKYGGRDFGHYFVPVVAPACLLGAAVFPPLRMREHAGYRRHLVSAGAIALTLLILAPFARQVADSLNDDGLTIAVKTFGEQAELWALYEPVGHRIAGLADDGDELYVPSKEAGFLWASGLQSASRHIHSDALQRLESARVEVELELCSDPPEWMIIFDGTWPNYLTRFETSQYEPSFRDGPVTVLRRVDAAPPMDCGLRVADP